MVEELKYPIKYAVLELKEQGGWTVGYKDITQGFIVSKCYVLESGIRYLSNGDSKIIHKVVFPLKNISEFRLSMQQGFSYSVDPITPSYDACGNPYPVDIVPNLFDTYEEAKNIAIQKNEEMQSELILNISSSDPNFKIKYEKLKTEFLENLEICKKYESFISTKTEDMNISDTQTEKIIRLVH